MFKPVPFEPAGRRRSRSMFRLPRWLVLMLIGVAGGAAGVLIAQEKYLPPRLSAGESAELRKLHAQAEAERARMQRELEDATKQLQSAVTAKNQAVSALEGSRATVEQLRQDVSAVVASLPPDPARRQRGGARSPVHRQG